MCCMEGTFTSSYAHDRNTFLSLHKSVYFTYTVRSIRYTDVVASQVYGFLHSWCDFRANTSIDMNTL